MQKSKCTQQKDRLKHGFIRIYERTEKETESPLASRLRPTTLDEMVGQQHIIGKDKLLYRAIKADKLSPSSSMDLREPERQRLRRLLPIPQAQNFYR